ncbi:MAG: hypothetical protein GW848_00395 [Rhodoferax sp.]|nr:hypothetical protein [Rhodoferax sp.]NCP53832.1 hypothetical protein [Rhodoferax sp.]
MKRLTQRLIFDGFVVTGFFFAYCGSADSSKTKAAIDPSKARPSRQEKTCERQETQSVDLNLVHQSCQFCGGLWRLTISGTPA